LAQQARLLCARLDQVLRLPPHLIGELIQQVPEECYLCDAVASAHCSHHGRTSCRCSLSTSRRTRTCSGVRYIVSPSTLTSSAKSSPCRTVRQRGRVEGCRRALTSVISA